ncbi:hypothetical protein [Dyadobacter jiangsuensis]|uniref:Uncharacterized protein n=1 Tax=Dyadobacter jiangsuensis TaxID=1591085 RepID=A0A2P8FR18_9BACT|nr:hypothetical protein [Dyadobacter jiangsuensis]PSL24176.1 hypothetical protein CLV60_1143 [Dyadobacter jiangsuensis]
MGKLSKILEELLQSIRGKDFKDTKKEIIAKKEKDRQPVGQSDSARSFGGNKREIIKDGRTVVKPDPYQVEVNKINERIKQAKALTPQDMKEIEKSLAEQDIKKDIFRSRMQMRSDEAKAQQAYHSASEDRKRDQKELSKKEKFLAAFKKKEKDKDHER